MPKFTRMHLVWIAIAVIIALYIFFPGAGSDMDKAGSFIW